MCVYPVQVHPRVFLFSLQRTMRLILSLAFLVSAEAWIPSQQLPSARRALSTLSTRTTIARAARPVDDDDDTPFYPIPRKIDEELLGDLTGGRPGAIIESEEQLVTKQRILDEIDDGNRVYPDWMKDYGNFAEDEEAEWDIDDPNLLDASKIGTWTIQDLNSKFPYEWDPNSGVPDPNKLELGKEGVRYVAQNEMDDDGVEVGYDPIFGPSNPIDTRTVLGAVDSYMIDDKTRDDSMIAPQFQPDDPEIEFNEDIVQFRKSMDVMETYTDLFLPDTMEIPRHTAKWHGYPEQTFLEPKNYTNNRFTETPTDFDAMTPFRARQRAVELARSQNAEWLPPGVAEKWHQEQRQPYTNYGTLVGTLKKGISDPDLVEQIQPALQVLGSCVDLLETIDGTIYRFAYHGLMKNKHGMKAWTESLLVDCGVEVTGVVFETGFRKRDPIYDGGDAYYGPRSS